MALNYGSTNSLACTSFNSLANSTTSLASSAAATTSTSNNIVDAMVQVKIVGPATMTASASTIVSVFAYGSLDGSTGWYAGASSGTVETVDGSDKLITVSANGNNLRFLGTILLHTTTSGTSITYQSQPLSVAAAFGGLMPRKWGIVIMNQSSAALAASGHDVRYTEIYYN